ncbi:MAG: IS4 family transposase [Gammaproteobacteria bacterium]|nr:IS4 family transposase [Gammaproteobacteria bacterium]MYH84508.1 IS4 family transposase [Gammaproteobacteria bacterium]MYK05607.1 IS4 family transposase [Gammaproteobacteria bacterium]
MYAGKTLFAQLMDFLPWTTFSRIVERYGGNHRVRTLPCTDHFRAMAFAQLTYRESLRDIEAVLSAQSAKLYHMGIRGPVRRSTLADANERRDWRIFAEFAQRLIGQARELYAEEDLGLDLSNTVYALDSTTVDLCLSLFPWAPFRKAKAAVKMHTLLDLRGNIPSFVHVSDGKPRDVNALDLLLPEPAAIYVMDRAYLDYGRLFALDRAGAFFVTRAKADADLRRVYSAPNDRPRGIELFFKWIKQHLRIKKFYGTSVNAVKTQIWVAVTVYVLVAIVRKRLELDASLYTLLQIFSVTLFEKILLNRNFPEASRATENDMDAKQLKLFEF